jgi:hypothetical protein
MKKKLTLTVEEEIIRYAKKLAKRQGKSVSQMFEEVFKDSKTNTIQTEQQKAASELIKKLGMSKSVQEKNDNELIKKHVKRKFT